MTKVQLVGVLFSVFEILFSGTTYGQASTPQALGDIGILKFKSTCSDTDKDLIFGLLFEIKYQDGQTQKDVYTGTCNYKSKSCKATVINAPKSGVLTVMDVIDNPTLEVLSKKGSVITLGFGPFRTIELDLAQKVARYSESGKSFITGKNVEGRAVTKCE